MFVHTGYRILSYYKCLYIHGIGYYLITNVCTCKKEQYLMEFCPVNMSP
jgi:hypothetical protein